MPSTDFELKPDQLRRKTDPASFSFASTEDLPPLEKVIGQERAVRSIDFGVSIPSFGYNIFAVGPAGSGRTTAVRQFLDRRAQDRPVPFEWCYVYNFEDPRRPRAVRLPPGRASRLRTQMADLVEQLHREVPRAFEGEPYEERRRQLMLEMQQKQQDLYGHLEEYLNERGFALMRNQTGLNIAPMVDGEILSGEAYQKLDPELKKSFESFRPELQEQFDRTMREARDLDRQVKHSIENINNELAGFVVDNLMADMVESFQDCPAVETYFEAVRKDVVQHVGRFVVGPADQNMPNPAMPPQQGERWFDRYQTNVLAESADCECAPVIVDDNPTYHNLVGRIEHRAEFGALVTDFTQIRAGALHRANGGYLIMQARDLLTNGPAWEALKRALRNREIKIEEMAQMFGLMATATLEPEPIPLDIKVVLIGDQRMHQLLHAYDEDFRDLFKVKAQFVATIPRDQAALEDYARFLGDLSRREDLRHFDPSAVARMVDEAARLAGDQEKVTTRFADVVDLARETSFHADQQEHDISTAADVRGAVEARAHRHNYAAERYVETIEDGIILIDTEGQAVGQINGLSVVQIGDLSFGLPSRITANTFMGRAGVVSIDREVKMTGPIHDKGQLILSSNLSSRFAQNRPLSVSASLTFEQSYSGIEGDSASSTELYALLSVLAGVPIKQHLAVTGSVNQSGQVQAIGGVNAKIEGFFDVCKSRGLTGDQGVLIPSSNVRHLMLRDDVVEAVAQGRFHVYAVSTIDEGIGLLTGMVAGELDENGDYPENSLYARVRARLDAYAQGLKEASDTDEEEEDQAGSSSAAESDDVDDEDTTEPETLPIDGN